MLYHLHRVDREGSRLHGSKTHAGFVRVHDISGVGRVHGRHIAPGDRSSPIMHVVPLFLSGGQVMEDVFSDAQSAEQAYDTILSLVTRDEGSDTEDLSDIESKSA